ncbi:hypothetical protein Tco_1364743, partial [Tanacetum coccineum]
NIDPTSGIRALETTDDEEVARKIQAEWDAEKERKRFEELKKTKPKTTLRKPTSLAQERNQMMSFLNIIWETAESSDDDFWKDQEEWEIIRWRFHESSGVWYVLKYTYLLPLKTS